MKMYMIIYDVDHDEDVMETLSQCCIMGYTKWIRVLGKGRRSDPKLDDAVWPGFNCVVMTGVEEGMEKTVFDALKSLHEGMEGRALKVFSWPVEKVI